MIRALHNLLNNFQCQDAIPLRRLTTFGIGGPAEIFLSPIGRDNFIRCLDLLVERNHPFRILGSGSNLLVDDRGVAGAIIKLKWRQEELAIQGTLVTAPAVMPLSRIIRAAAAAGLSGLEFAAGIPGTVGGAVVMNAGWGGKEISDVVNTVTVYRPGVGVEVIPGNQCRFAYRASRFQQEQEVILEAGFILSPGDPVAIQSEMEDVLRRRQEALPLEYPSAGSVFKNPPGDYAGRLIEAAGLKGRRIGDAQISEKHANVIVNRGSARSRAVEELIALAREKVRENFGVELELELKVWR